MARSRGNAKALRGIQQLLRQGMEVREIEPAADPIDNDADGQSTEIRIENPADRRERLIEALLAAGNVAQGMRYLEAALAACDGVLSLLESEQPNNPDALLREAYVQEARGREALLRANTMAHVVPQLTSELRNMYTRAIELNHDFPIMLGLAHRAFGVVLAYHGRTEEAEMQLAVAYGKLETGSPEQHNQWAHCVTELALVLLEQGNIERAVGCLLRVCWRLEADGVGLKTVAKTSRPIHVAAAVQLSMILWQAQKSERAAYWARLAYRRARELDKYRQKDEERPLACIEAIFLHIAGPTIFSMWMRVRRQPLSI